MQIYNRYLREAIALKRIFPHERFSLWDFIRLFIHNVLSDYQHALHDRLLPHNVGGIFSFRLMQFWGTYRGSTRRSPVTDQLRQTFYYPKSWSPQRSGGAELESRRHIDYSDSETEDHLNGDN